MKEQIIVGVLALSLAVGFIFSIEVLAHRDRSYPEDFSGSCLAHSRISKLPAKNCSEFENCVDSKTKASSVATFKTKICMAGRHL